MRFLKKGIVVAGIALVALGGAFGSIGVGAAEDPITARKAIFKGYKDQMGLIKAAVENGQPMGVLEPTSTILTGIGQLALLFPPGSDKGDTKALPELWSNPQDVAKKWEAMTLAATALLTAGTVGDAAAVSEQFKALGGTCKSCHDSYRAK
jgi:cytochrome c556